jgi:predicted Zn finger-like uncharacterized protein
MFTRCPECLDVHRLSASLLAHAGGRVRCGNCDQEFNAVAHLFDHWPDSGTTPSATLAPEARPPVLGTKTMIPGDTGEPKPGNAEPEPESHPGNANRSAWQAIFVLLLLITISNAAWTFREPLSAHPGVRGLLVRAGLMDAEVVQEFRDLSRLHLVSRDMHKHPTRAGMLALSVTFVNRAARAQPYPGLEVTLTDAAGLGLARREFSAADYLPSTGAATGLLAPNTHVPILLEFADPGDNAIGFDIAFR